MCGSIRAPRWRAATSPEASPMSVAAVPTATRRFRLADYPVAVVISALWLLSCLSLIALLPGLPRPPDGATDLVARLKPPVGWGGEWPHALGTRDLGRDISARPASSLRASLALAFGATIISATIGTTIGIIAGHFGGWVDQLVVATIDTQVSVPFIIVSLTLTAFFGNNL